MMKFIFLEADGRNKTGPIGTTRVRNQDIQEEGIEDRDKKDSRLERESIENTNFDDLLKLNSIF